MTDGKTERSRISVSNTMRQLAKHAVATVVLTGCTVCVTLVVYFGLLAWAVLAGSPIGGPLALPFMLVLALLMPISAAVVVLGPATALSEVLCRNMGGARKWVQIPVSTVLLLTEVLLFGALIANVRHESVVRGATDGLTAGVILLVPLGIYWWTFQATDWLLHAGAVLWRRLYLRIHSE